MVTIVLIWDLSFEFIWHNGHFKRHPISTDIRGMEQFRGIPIIVA